MLLALAALPLMAMSGPHSPSPETAASGAKSGELTVRLEGLRSNKGKVHLCLTDRREDYIDCADHPDAMRREFAATNVASIHFDALRPGTYYLLVLHDENGNGKLDTTLGIPREGFGFSGNPKIRMGPPRARDVGFELRGADAEQRIKLRYLL